MLKTKFEFQSSYAMDEEQSKRHEKYIKAHKPKGETIEDYNRRIVKERLRKDKKEWKK